MHKIKLYLLLAITLLSLHTSARQLSNEARIALITCSPGDELYSLFGHSAIRVTDPVKKMDIVFNYGTFDFNTEHFYFKFVRGLLPYQLTISSFDSFINAYIYDDRSVFSQELLLDSLERQKLFDALVENYKPINRTYLYNFLYDNCSTRIRDILEKSYSGTIEWNIQESGKSFWNLLDEYLIRMPWTQWGIHTILGQSGSRKATPQQEMFLPDYLMQAFEKATINGEHIAQEPETLYLSTSLTPTTSWYLRPGFIFAIFLFVIIYSIQYFRSYKLLNTIAGIMFLFTGLLGLLFIFLGYFTKHPITSPNLNLIWGNPLNLIAVPYIFKKQLPYFIKTYLTYYAFILLVGAVVWFIALPAVPLASLYIIMLMIFLAYKLKIKQIPQPLE